MMMSFVLSTKQKAIVFYSYTDSDHENDIDTYVYK